MSAAVGQREMGGADVLVSPSLVIYGIGLRLMWLGYVNVEPFQNK